MNKFFLSIATSAVCLTGFATQAQAAPGWAVAVANESCRLMRQGVHPRTAGRKAALSVMSGPQSGALMTAYNRGNWESTLQSTLFQTCPSTLVRAAQRHSL